jgi:hypothetical protein
VKDRRVREVGARIVRLKRGPGIPFVTRHRGFTPTEPPGQASGPRYKQHLAAKPIGPKTSLIRDAIEAHPDKGNNELAEMINTSPARKEDKFEVRAQDVAQKRQALKKIGRAEAERPAARVAVVLIFAD